jgi:DNA polymerase-3 subunit beta
MRVFINREALLKPLQLISGVISPRQSLPILGNILLDFKNSELLLTGTDLEIEFQARITGIDSKEVGAVTVPARKFLDICRSLPENTEIELITEDSKLLVRAGRSRFNLSTLPAVDFPDAQEMMGEIEFNISSPDLKSMFEKTSFAMAQQDVRYYLNGTLINLTDNQLFAVATDGHRMALSRMDMISQQDFSVIIPRKAILELTRLLGDIQNEVTVTLNHNQLRVKSAEYNFISKLIDGQFPDYNRVIPPEGDKIIIVDRDTFKQVLGRVAVLSNEKHHGMFFELSPGLIKLTANNPDHEEAEEEIAVDYQGESLEMGFNINYLLDAVNALSPGNIKITLATANTSIRIEHASDLNYNLYIVMPMRF